MDKMKITFLTGSFFVAVLMCSCALSANKLESTQTPAAVQQTAKVEPTDPAAHWRKLDLKKYPDANTIILDDISAVKYYVDGSDVSRNEVWVLIVTDKGRAENSDFQLYFNDFYHCEPQLEIELIKPDGRVVKPFLQKKVSVESSQMNSNIYDPANKILSVGIPGVEKGDIVHYVVSRKTIRPRMKGVWCDIAVMQDTDPVLHCKYTVSAPAGLPLKSIAVKDETSKKFSRSQKKVDDRIIYTFESNDVPQIIPEPDMPPAYLVAQRVLVSSAGSWEDISRWYYDLCEPRLKAVSPELTAHAKKLTAGKSPENAVRALFDFVSKEIRYTGVTNENTAPGYEPHDVKDTFAQKHGVCRDKAALLAAMLRESGFDAFMVLFMSGDPKDKEIPNNYFNHAVTGVKMPDGKLVLMDPTDENSVDLLPSYAMDKSFLCATKSGDTLQRTPVVPAEKNALKIKSSAKIDSDFKLHLTSELTFEGINDNIYRGAFAEWTPEKTKQFVASALKNSLPGCELTEVKILPENIRDLSKPLQMIISCQAGDYVDISWGDGIVNMPFLGSSFGAFNIMLNDRLLPVRCYPVQFFSTAAIEEICTLQLPDDLQLAALPEKRNWSNKFLTVMSKVEKEKNVLSGFRKLALDQVQVTPDVYPDFFRNVKKLFAAQNDPLIVKRKLDSGKNAFAGASAVELDCTQNVNIESPEKVSVEVSRKLKIMNYSGVKQYSELSLDYIESLSKGEFTFATVTLPDGKILKADLAACKVMDAPESADAPRYPAKKYLILPLPGITPGCVVEYGFRETFSKTSEGCWGAALQSNVPQLKQLIAISYPARMEKKLTFLLPENGFELIRGGDSDRRKINVCSSNIPLRPLEPSTPPAWLYAPMVSVSWFDHVKYIDSVKKYVDKALINTPEAGAKALEITAGKTQMRDKVIAIRDFVARHIRCSGLEINAIGPEYISHADRVLREGYGNSADRAVLLYAMLKSIGVNQVDFILASSLPYLDIVISKYQQMPKNVFDELLLRVNVDDEEFLLNDTDEYSVPGSTSHDGCLGLDFASAELVKIESLPGCASRRRSAYQIKCLEDGSAEIKVEHYFYGSDYAVFNRLFDRITPKKEEQFWFEQCHGVLAQAQLLEKQRDFTGYPGIITMRFKVPDFWIKSGNFASLLLPESPAARVIRTAGKRTLPYWFNNRVDQERVFTITLPESWQNCELAGGSYELSLPGNSQSITMQSRFLQKDILEIRESISLEQFLLENSAYSLLEALQKKLTDKSNRTILFKTTGK